MSVKIIGLQELESKIRSLRDSKIKRIVRQSVSNASSIVLKAMRQNVKNVPKRTGTLRKALKRKIKTYRSGVTSAMVGIDSKLAVEVDLINYWTGKVQKQTIKPSKYAHLVELGTKPHAILRGKNNSGTISHPGTDAHPFAKPALETNKEQVANRIKEEIIRKIEEALK